MAKDLTVGNPAKVLLAFSMPMLIGNVVQQFYNMADLVIVGRFVGVNALAAVGATGSTMFLMFSLIAGLANGATVVISQYYGSGEQEKTKQAIATAIYVMGGMSILLTLIGLVIVRPVLQLMHTPPEIMGGAITYLTIIVIGIGTTVAYNGTAGILRALGDSVTPLVFLIIAALLNIGLDLLFVITFNMGVGGAALATVLAQLVSAIASILYAMHKMPILHLQRNHFQLDKRILKQTVQLGLPGGLQNSLVALGSMLIQSLVNSFGPQVVAAYAGATKLDQLAIQPFLSLSMASTTFTAQNMGAGHIDRVRKGFWSSLGLVVAFCIIITPLLFFGGRAMMSLFVDSSELHVLQVGQQYLQITSAFYIAIGVVILLENFLRGTGDIMVPLVSNIAEIAVRIAVAYGFAIQFGYLGIWWAAPIAWCVGVVICSIRYASGKWQYKSLVSKNMSGDQPEPTIDG